MRYFSLSMCVIAFFGLLAFAVWWTSSAWCLWALLLTPGIKFGGSSKSESEADDEQE